MHLGFMSFYSTLVLFKGLGHLSHRMFHVLDLLMLHSVIYSLTRYAFCELHVRTKALNSFPLSIFCKVLHIASHQGAHNARLSLWDISIVNVLFSSLQLTSNLSGWHFDNRLFPNKLHQWLWVIILWGSLNEDKTYKFIITAITDIYWEYKFR